MTGSRTLPPAPADFPLSDKGRCYEDFTVGQRLDHHWGRTLTDADNVLFNSLTLNYTPLFGNDVYARAQGLRERQLNPYLVFLTVLGLSVEDTSERDGGMFLGVESVEFPMPVYPGTTLTARSEVLATRESKSRPSTGIVSWRTEGTREDGEVVLTFVRTNLVVRRNPR